MSTVGRIVEIKRQGNQRGVHTISADCSVLEATRLMNQHHIGALIVMRGAKVAGIFTERDVLTRVVAVERAPATTLVAEVMTRDLIRISPEAEIGEASEIMRSHRVRHLPVCEPDGTLIGLVSIGDLNAEHASRQEQTIHHLTDYIYGRA